MLTVLICLYSTKESVTESAEPLLQMAYICYLNVNAMKQKMNKNDLLIHSHQTPLIMLVKAYLMVGSQ